MVKLARTYVLVLLLFEIFLFTAVLLLHISLGVGLSRPSVEFTQALLVGILLVSFPLAALAKEKNVWKNEFKSCPMWLRGVVLLFWIYGLIIIVFRVAPSSDIKGAEDFVAISALMLSVNVMWLCIPCAVLWTRPLQATELVKRSRTSFIVAVVVMTVAVVYRVGFLPHPVR